MFIIYGKKQSGIDFDNAIFWNETKIKNINELLKNSSKIILHSLFIPQYILKLLIHKSWIKKTYWIVWGGDLHLYERRKTSFKAWILEFLHRKLIKNLRGICTLVPGDYDLAKKWYHTNAKYFEAIYILSTENVEYTLSLKNVNQNKKKRILIGNSATQTNEHIEVFNMLDRKNYDNIEIICPLSYGDSAYREQVINCGKKLFADNFKPIIQYLSSKQYIKLLNTIDIAIFNNTRQQALGNIYYLMLLKKNIFMRPGSEMWDYLVNKEKYTIYDINDFGLEIENEDYEKLYSNQEKMICRNSYENACRVWRKIFDD